MKLKELHPIVLTQPTHDTVQLVCPCGWKGTLWSHNPKYGSPESGSTREERVLHLLEEMEVAVTVVEVEKKKGKSAGAKG